MEGEAPPVPRPQRKMAGYKRLFLITMVCAFHIWSTSVGDSGVSMVAPLENMRDELFPDTARSFEKLENGMDMMIQFSEFNTANEVVKLVTWTQQMCATGAGAEAHLASPVLPQGTWMCTIEKIRVERPGSAAALGFKLDSGTSHKMCDSEWLKKHVITGQGMHDAPFGRLTDDPEGKYQDFDEWPYNERSIFWGSMKGMKPCPEAEIDDSADAATGPNATLVALDGHNSTHSGGPPGGPPGGAGGIPGMDDRPPEAAPGQEGDVVRGNQAPMHRRNRVDCLPPPEAPEAMVGACQGTDDNDCRNHHWGPLFYICRPKHTVINFFVENQAATMQRAPNDINENVDTGVDWDKYFFKQYIQIVQEYWAIADTGWYRASIQFFAGRYPLSANSWWGFVFIPTIILWWAISPLALWTLLMTPVTLVRLMILFYSGAKASPGQIQTRVFDLFDYGAKRSRGLFPPPFRGAKVGFMMLLLENFSCYAYYLGLFMSIRGTWEPRYPWETGNPNKPYVQEECGMDADADLAGGSCPLALFSAYDLLTLNHPLLQAEMKARRQKAVTEGADGGWNLRIDKADKLRILSMWLRTLFFGPQAEYPYSLALFFLVIRAGEIFWHVPSWRWFPETMMLCFGQLFNFLVMLFFIVAGFAAYFCGRFGNYFVAFYSVNRSVANLMFYVCGLFDPFSYHLHTYEEQRALELTISLGLFHVVVLIVSLNFFTAIVMTAYTYATEEPARQRKYRLRMTESAIWHTVFWFFGVPEDEARKYLSQNNYPLVALESDDDVTDEGNSDDDKPLLAADPE